MTKANYTVEWINGEYVTVPKRATRVVSLDAVTTSNVRGSNWKVWGSARRDQVTRATSYADWNRSTR